MITHDSVTLVLPDGSYLTGVIEDDATFKVGSVDWKGRFRPTPESLLDPGIQTEYDVQSHEIETMNDGFGDIGHVVRL